MTHHPEDLAAIQADVMSRHAPLISVLQAAFITPDRQAERKACIHAALTFRRLSWSYRRAAIAAEAINDITEYRANASEARRLWREARKHLTFARGLNGRAA